MKTLAAGKELSVYRRALPQFLAVGCKNLVLLGYGMTAGFPTIVIPAVQGGDGRHSSEGEFHMTDEEISWLGSINLLCVPIGCFLSGLLCEPCGKRRAMQLVSVPMIFAWLLFHFAKNVNYLYVGLCLTGLSGGLMEAPVLTYVAEVTQPQFRGMLAASGTTCFITGIFIQFILGTFLSWRTVAIVSMFLPVFTISALFFVPESPYWLLTKGREEETKRALCWLRGWVPFEKVEDEYNQIHDALETKRLEAEAVSQLPFYKRMEPFSKRSFIVPFILVSGTFLIGHFTGKTPLQTYAVQIFHTLKAPIDKYYATILLGGAELVGALLCVVLVHITGKRPLVLASLIGVGSCFCGTATYAYFLNEVPGASVENVVSNYSMKNLDRTSYVNEHNLTEALNLARRVQDAVETTTYDFMTTYDDEYNSGSGENSTEAHIVKRMNLVETPRMNETLGDFDPNKIILTIPNAEENKYLWIPLVLLITGAVFSHLGIRIIPWILIGEVFPVNVRSASSGLSSGIGYVFAFLANKLFLQMVATMTLAGTFWFYSSVAFVGFVILYFALPETEGRTLLEIEEHFMGKKSLYDKDPKTSNNRTNGIDLVTVAVPSLEKPPINDINANSLTIDGARSEHRLSVPEIFVTTQRQPGAGSKRYKHRVSDTIRSRSSIASSNDDVQDTHL